MLGHQDNPGVQIRVDAYTAATWDGNGNILFTRDEGRTERVCLITDNLIWYALPFG